MEIERKFLLKELPDLTDYTCHEIQQAYLCITPVVRIRRQDDTYYLTYKSGGMMAREEYNLPLNRTAYYHLLAKSDGNVITKRRYLIPLTDPRSKTDGYTFSSELVIELDVFSGKFQGVTLAEVEFSCVEDANEFLPPDWFSEDVTMNPLYHNSAMRKSDVLFHTQPES